MSDKKALAEAMFDGLGSNPQVRPDLIEMDQEAARLGIPFDRNDMPGFMVIRDDGSFYCTSMAVGTTIESARQYFLGSVQYNRDDVKEKHRMTVVRVEQLPAGGFVPAYVETDAEGRFNHHLHQWLIAVQRLVVDPQANTDNWSPANPYCTLRAEDQSSSIFLRIVSSSLGSRSAWAFVAKRDGSNKKLGQYKAGDIFKCDGWKGPAKTARGNIFDTSAGPTCRISRYTGPDYLK